MCLKLLNGVYMIVEYESADVPNSAEMLSNTHQIKLEKIFRFQSWVFEYGNMVISMSVSFGMRSKY